LNRDPLKDKEVIIIRGDWKGYKGIAVRADENKVMIEL
jgi:transcription elongation factor